MSHTTHNLTRRAFLGTTGLALVSVLTSCSRLEEFGGGAPKPAASSSDGGPRSLDEIRASGVCNVGLVSDNRPLSGIDGAGHYCGMDDYFGLWFTERTWIGLNYVAVDPRDRYDRLLSGEIDICFSEMSPLDTRASEVAFADPIYQVQLGIVSPKDEPITEFEQLEGGTLIVCEGSYAEQYAAATWPNVERRSYPSFSSARNALEAGMGTALLDEEIPAVWWLKEHGAYTLGIKAVGEQRKLAPAVATGNDALLEELTRVTTNFIDTGWSKNAFEYVVMEDVGESYASMLCKLEPKES